VAADEDTLRNHGLSTPTVERVTRLERDMGALCKVAVAQAAMIAMLSSLLAGKKTLTPQECLLVAMAGKDAQEYSGLTAENIEEWSRKQFLSLAAQGAKDDGA